MLAFPSRISTALSVAVDPYLAMHHDTSFFCGHTFAAEQMLPILPQISCLINIASGQLADCLPRCFPVQLPELQGPSSSFLH